MSLKEEIWKSVFYEGVYTGRMISNTDGIDAQLAKEVLNETEN